MSDDVTDSFDALANEGEALLRGAPGPSTTPAPVTQTEVPLDLPICQQGPCRHHVTVKLPTGMEVSAGRPLVSERHFCRAGVVFPEAASAGRLALSGLSLGQPLPLECTQWAPFTDDELVEQAERRIAAQDRIALRREAEALQRQPDEAQAPVADPGPAVSEIPIPDLPETFDDLKKGNDE